MKCHPLRWIWGLLPIALLSLIAAASIKPLVENDLTTRALADLKGGEFDWAKISFDGRDGTISGRANDESEPGKAINLSNQVYGVRIVDGKPELLRKVDPYTWSAGRADNKITLTGFVPNQTVRKAVVAAAKSQFPKADIDDKLDYARGNPLAADFVDGAKYGLKQLAQLKSGKAELSGLALSVTGEALSAAAYKDVRTALSGGLPKALKLGRDGVTAPLVAPYTWMAKLAGNQVVLSGYVPSEAVRSQMLAQAQKAFGKTTIVDRMEYGDGEPENWDKASKVALDQLATLQDGVAELKGKDLTLSGVAVDDSVADATRKAFKAQVPGVFKTAEAIKGAKPAQPAISPYVTRVDVGASAIDLAGHVPSEAARSALVAVMKAKFPGRNINDRLQLGSGESAGYEPCLMAAVGGIARIGGGAIAMTDKVVELSGRTEDEALAVALPGDVRSAAKGACETKVMIAYDDSKKRAAAAEAEARAKAEAEAAATAKARRDADLSEKAKRDAELAERARREAEIAAQAKREAEKAAEEAKRLAALAAAQQKAQPQPQPQTKSPEATACESGLRTAASAGVVQFERASNVLAKQSLPTLRQLADIANKCENVLIEIEGHTDSEGVPERNQPLSERRAQAVVDFLASAGVNADRVKAVGYGDTKPIAPNDTPENRAKNRRIEFTVRNK